MIRKVGRRTRLVWGGTEEMTLSESPTSVGRKGKWERERALREGSASRTNNKRKEAMRRKDDKKV